MTVADLIRVLKTLNPDAVVMLSNDAEGNEILPLDYVAATKKSKVVDLFPKHY